ncbi:AraC family transcriptional regulator [Geodermatophilus sp. DSM 45219]|uniref:AraC-like ligand-binding domain-containing protein n=1 Tax=Geodermatophilus sp. DSM 45219 TaxID=1881103 RepID=UPI0008837674|nr:AraC family transcriptional regulator [Geodermatophilus sp. DSM 45219]SDO33110.1 transcriptional regulator, AraC family [Geodermatophilus sp. DSM 45219]
MHAEHEADPGSAGVATRPRTLTTDEVTPGQAFARWQDLISDTFVPLVAAPTTGRPFRGRIVHSTVGQVQLTTVRAGGQHVRRTPRLIARSPEEYVLASIQVAGRGEVSQSGRTALLHPGGMAFYDSTRPYTLQFPAGFEQLVVQVPRRGLPAAAVERATGVALAADSSGRLVADFFRGLAHLSTTDPVGAAALAPHAIGLLTSALCLAAGSSPLPGPSALDRERVLAHLAAHFADPRLDADTVARACHLSRRTLFRLFEHEPESLGDVLRRLRVSGAQRLLRTEPRLPLAAVAARCGFGGGAQLHRAFRGLTGTTPAAYRRGGAG